MLLRFVQGTLYTQSNLAADMGTDSSGTYVYRITNTLNSKLGSTQYQHVLNSSYDFGNSLIYCIDRNKPIICHVKTGKLPNYNNMRDDNHYIVAIGYDWYASGGTGYSNVRYNDCHWNSAYYGTFTCTVSEMVEAINRNAGFYIRAN